MPRPAKRGNAAVTASASSSIPLPFSAASDRLRPFLDLLDPAKVYIVHLDKLPLDFKRQIFAVPVLMNILIVIGLLWRWYVIVPKYLQLTTIIAGVNDPALAGVGATFRDKAWLTLRRALMFAIDFFLIRVILPWPVSFFFEQPANPVKWRRKVRFQDVEIIVRESRQWGAEELLRGDKVGQESPFFRARVLPGVAKNFLREKTGYSMMGKDWDLDFANMINAAILVEQKTMMVKDFEATVFAHDQAHGWLEWVVHKEDENTEDADRARLVAFKDSLTLMGKEHLFFRWIELIQYESEQPGGMNANRRKEVVEKARDVFTAQGVDFVAFVTAIGGIDAFPGLAQTET